MRKQIAPDPRALKDELQALHEAARAPSLSGYSRSHYSLLGDELQALHDAVALEKAALN